MTIVTQTVTLDFGAVPKVKKAIINRVQAKPSSLFNYLNQAPAAPKPAVASTANISAPSTTTILAANGLTTLDGVSDLAKGVRKGAATAGKSKKPATIMEIDKNNDDNDDFDDVFSAVAKDVQEAEASAAPARKPRAAAYQGRQIRHAG